MNCTEVSERLIDFADGLLSTDEHKAVASHLAACSSCKAELEQYRTVLAQIDADKEIQIPRQLNLAFEQMLRTEMPEHKTLNTKWLRIGGMIAAASVLLLLGWWWGASTAVMRTHEARIERLEQQVGQPMPSSQVLMMQEVSASKRLEAVQSAAELPKADAQILAALAERLANDPQMNVRLAAVRALTHFGKDEQVRNVLLAALNRQTDPMIQIAIIDALVAWNENRAIPELYKLSTQDSLQMVVKQRAEQGIGQLHYQL